MVAYWKKGEYVKYNHLKGVKKGGPAACGAAIAVHFGYLIGLGPTESVLIGGVIANYVWDILKRTVWKKYMPF